MHRQSEWQQYGTHQQRRKELGAHTRIDRKLSSADTASADGEREVSLLAFIGYGHAEACQRIKQRLHRPLLYLLTRIQMVSPTREGQNSRQKPRRCPCISDIQRRLSRRNPPAAAGDHDLRLFLIIRDEKAKLLQAVNQTSGVI